MIGSHEVTNCLFFHLSGFLSIGGRFGISKRASVNIGYYYVISKQTPGRYTNPLSIGFDTETGGHVFRLYVSNAEGLTEQHIIGRTTGKWLDGDIHTGFNISRAFTVKKPKGFRDK